MKLVAQNDQDSIDRAKLDQKRVRFVCKVCGVKEVMTIAEVAEHKCENGKI